MALAAASGKHAGWNFRPSYGAGKLAGRSAKIDESKCSNSFANRAVRRIYLVVSNASRISRTFQN